MKTGLRFTEWMDGFVALGENDCEAGYVAGKQTGSRLALRLTLSLQDLRAWIRSRERLLHGEGVLTHSPLGNDITVRGSVNQLIGVPGDRRRKTMPYELELIDAGGRPLTLRATKYVNPPLRRSWKDTTTLYVLIVEGNATIGAGIVKISFPLFLRQFLTYRCWGGTFLRRRSAPFRFYAAFIGRLWEVYGF